MLLGYPFSELFLQDMLNVILVFYLQAIDLQLKEL